MSKLNYKRAVSDMPLIVSTVDVDVIAFLASLPEPSFESVTSGKLWSIPCTGPTEAEGSAFLCSAEAAKRAQAGRLLS